MTPEPITNDNIAEFSITNCCLTDMFFPQDYLNKGKNICLKIH